MEYNKYKMPFLNNWIQRNENGIWIDLYHKR